MTIPTMPSSARASRKSRLHLVLVLLALLFLIGWALGSPGLSMVPRAADGWARALSTMGLVVPALAARAAGGA